MQLCPTRGPHVAQSKVLCGPCSLGCRCNKSILYSDNLYFDDLEFEIFDAGGLQCHFITYVTNAVTIRIFQ